MSSQPAMPVAPPVDPGLYRETMTSRHRMAHWWFALAVVLAGLPAVWGSSEPGGLLWILVTLVLWVALGIVWFVWLIQTGFGGPGITWRFAIAPAVVVGMAVLVLSPLPLHVRFTVERADLDAVLLALPPESGHGVDASAGSYRFASWERQGSAVLFQSDAASPAGFAYLPDGVPAATDPGDLWGYQVFNYRQLDGPWYEWDAIW